MQFQLPDAHAQVFEQERARREHALGGDRGAFQPNGFWLFCARGTQAKGERVTRLELATSTLARWCSTN